MKLVLKLWKDESQGEFTYCLAGAAGDEARGLLEGHAELIWSCEAISHFDAMTQYYAFQDWGEYTTVHEQDYWPFINSLGEIRPPAHG